MNIHDILLVVQYITIGVLFIEILIVFLKWKNTIHSYLFFTCISSFISNLGYLFEMKAGSEESYLTALKISYVGRVWIALAFFLFSAKMCGRKIPKGLIGGLVAVHTGIYITVLTIEKNDLYYRGYQFIPDPVFPQFVHGNGYVHDLLMALNGIYIVFAMVWVIMAFRKEKNRKAKYRLLMLLTAFAVQASSFILQITGIVSISQYYDLTMPGALFGNIFMIIAIFGFDLMGTRQIAKDFVTDRISEGIIALDNDGRIQYYNEPASKLFPEFDSLFGSQDAAGKNNPSRNDNKTGSAIAGRVFTPYDIVDTIAAAVRNKETISIGDRIFTPEENELVYKGESYGKLYALVDDTEHFLYMEELQKQRDIADNANEAKSRFLANMSHEIRTPINAVLGMDEMILRESSEKNTRAYAANIMSAGRTLLSIINDILDLSKVEEGKMEIIPVSYDLSSLIGDLVNMIRDRAVKKGLKLNLKADTDIPHLLIGDEIRIRQCVMNLLTNAVKYTEKGEVTLDVTFEKKDEKHIFLRFVVEDTGIGMKAEDMENLFLPYKRIEEKRNRSIEGTGLGMSITRQLLELMGSRLEVQSEYGKGSVFSFSVEQEVEKWEKIGDITGRLGDGLDNSYEYHELFHAPNTRILVVDDTEMNLTVIQSLLKKTGIKIDTASSGKEAVKMAESASYDVLFIDHMMPDMDGIETLKAIRGSGMNTETPAVALTANAISGAREMYLESGFTDYLSKPVDGIRLEKLLMNRLPAEKVLSPDSELPAGSEAEEETDKENFSDIPEKLQGIQEIKEMDTAVGLKNCGSEEGYISVLSVFHKTAQAKADEIEQLYNDKDIEGYTVKVHALKSSARIIGAQQLSDLAKALEDAGNRKDTELIERETKILLDMYRGLDVKLSVLDRDSGSLPEIGEEELKEAYQTMAEIAGSMDYGLMEDLLKSLEEYALPSADKEKVAKVEELLTRLDWDGIMQVVRGGE